MNSSGLEWIEVEGSDQGWSQVTGDGMGWAAYPFPTVTVTRPIHLVDVMLCDALALHQFPLYITPFHSPDSFLNHQPLQGFNAYFPTFFNN